MYWVGYAAEVQSIIVTDKATNSFLQEIII